MLAANRFATFVAVWALSACMLVNAGADEIAVGNYGIAANGMPYAVALEKKLYQQEGANVTGIISSQGGGTSIRNMLAGGVAYGEPTLCSATSTSPFGSTSNRRGCSRPVAKGVAVKPSGTRGVWP